MADELDAAPEEGQAVEAPEGQGQPFFEVDYDGKHLQFADPEQLRKTFNDSVMMQNRFTQKTTELSEQRKTFESERKEFERIRKEQAEEYKAMERLVQERPEVYNYLVQKLNSPPGPEAAYERSVRYADEKTQSLEERLKRFEQWQEQQESEREKQFAIANLKQRYPDLGEEQVDEMMNMMSNGIEGIIEAAYLAHKGRMSPAQAAEMQQQREEEKKAANVVRGKSGAVKNDKTYKSLDELGEALKNSDL